MNDSTGQSNSPFPFLTDSYRTLADDVPVAMMVKDSGGKILFANTAYLEFSGRDLQKLIGKNDYDFVSEQLAAKYRRIDQQVIEHGQPYKAYGKHRALDGRTLLIEYHKKPVFDDAGAVVAIQFMCWDVTRRKNAETALAHERFLFDSLLENAADLIYFKDQQSRFTRVSKSVSDRFGVTQQDLPGKKEADFIVAEHADQTRADEQQIMASREPIISQLEFQKLKDIQADQPDAGTWYSTTKIPLLDEEQNIIGIFGISRDVTELKKSREKLQNALLMADGASRAKSEFVANMSHEIRTPMNGIIGIAELLSTTKLDADQREYVDMIQQSSESLMGLLNDILDFSKIEAGKLELSSIPFNLSDSVGKTIQTLAGSANEKGLELACRISPELPERLIGDPSRLRQVVVNLVGNAIKFTESGEVVVEVNSKSVSDKIAILQFTVRDTGIGIPPEKQSVIFEEFSQADSSTTRRFGGTGLGLTISRQLVELMGGEIWIDEQVRSGTTFHFTAEFGVAEEQPATSQFQLDSLEGVPALVVDDNATNRRIVGEMLKGWALVPKEVNGGVAAITEMQRAAKAGIPYRLVLLDCMMPGMDGFSVAELITGNPVFKSPTIIMISSAAGLGDAARCKAAGITHHMIKPVIKSELFDVIVDAFGQRQIRFEQNVEAQPTYPSKLSVLLVEDDPINQYVAEGFLKHGNHDVTCANTGQQALDLFEERLKAGQTMFDLILMDIQMPNMDGFKTTALMRAKETNSGGHVPIIAMTAAAMKGDRERCLRAGMDGYLAKPIEMKQLFETMSEHVITKHENSIDDKIPRTESPVTDNQREPDTPPAADNATAVQIDFDQTLRNIPHEEGFLNQLLTIFLKECPSLVAQFQQSHQIGDFDGMKRAAHTLQGSCRILHAPELASLARHLESLAIEKNVESISLFVPRFVEVASQTCEAIKVRLSST
jgi:PAS domain S-box-containing protein